MGSALAMLIQFKFFYESLLGCVTNACVTLSIIENLLIRICGGILVHGITLGDLTLNFIANRDCEIPFNIFC